MTDHHANCRYPESECNCSDKGIDVHCVQCGDETITDAKGICYDCWAENDLKDHEEQLAKKNSNSILDASGNNMVDVDKSTSEE